MRALLQNSALHIAIGFTLMGSWAWFANRSFDWPAPLIAALVQGAITACMTYVLKRVIETVSPRVTGIARYILPVLAASAMSATLLTVLHSLAGTPALWLTILVPFCVATIYAITYAFTYAKLHP